MVELIHTNPAAIDRVLVYRWLSGFFAREIEIEILNFYRTTEGNAFLDELEAEPCFLPLISAVRGIIEDEEALHTRLLDLRSVYAKLFLGAGGRRSAPPYHSAYASDKGLLFQSQMTEMADILRELDLSVVTSMKEPPDHIAVQLNVMAELAARSALDEYQLSAPERAQASRRQIAFMDGHLLSWLPAFRDDCAAHDPSQFYALVASATFAFLEQDRNRLFREIDLKN